MPKPLSTDIGARVEARIADLFRREIDRWEAVNPDLTDPLQSLCRLVEAGGKRLRPAFCFWAFVGAGGSADDPLVVDVGAALEMLHTFALVHDDIMDGSATRRGLDTVHVSYGHTHAASAWRGEDRRFGEGVAILVGDLAFVYADLLMAGAPRQAVDVFTELRLEAHIGQYLDVINTARGSTSADAARLVAVYKSGKYTIERPLHMGAALAGRLDELGPAFSGYGLPLGEAFQLRDDLLGAFGDEATLGKPVGDDLREGKPTLLVALAHERAGASGQRLLRRLGARDLSDDEVAALQELLVDSGARAAVEGEIERLTARSLEALDTVDLTPEPHAALAGLARFVAGRDH